MIRGKCPICGRAFSGASLDALPGFPFCSERCRLIDLGRWIDGDYAVPGKPTSIVTTPNGPVPAAPDMDDEDED